MKILVIQLARLGDIYTTWPILRALKRKFPDAQLDLLVRKRFAEACEGLEYLSGLHIFESDQVLEPLLSSNTEQRVEGSVKRLRAFTDSLLNAVSYTHLTLPTNREV